MNVLGLCAVALLSVAPVLADSIVVVNHSFEDVPSGMVPADCSGGYGPGCWYNLLTVYGDDYTTIPGWTGANWHGSYVYGAYYIGQVHPGNPSPDFVELSDGPTEALTTGMIYQTVGATVESGQTYTLLVDIGAMPRLPYYGFADLLINGNRYAATGTGPAPGYWSTFTAVYTGSDADVGKAITIELYADQRNYAFDPIAFFDNVRLAATPEPASAGIAAIGLLGLLAFARRRAA